MRMQWDQTKQRMMPGGITRSEHNDLPLPGGKKIADLSNGDLANVLIDAGIPGIDHKSPRSKNLDAYSEFLWELMWDAANRASAEWLKSKS